ncbi:Aldo-keto reductase [Cladobotryum mycophilum]|uniref:Aldo-keto reductase n=1 Tax=Cladobotryum mycophilum TaxID=491253 RepID=A0ABR0SJH7_9HYPO
MPLIAQSPKNRIILGLMTFGPDESAGARITDLDTFNKVLDVLQSRGYNEIDTARLYGLSLATKVIYPSNPGDNAADKVVESVETSLKELGTDSVDILYLHKPDRAVPFVQTLEAMDRLHKAGKFRTFAISNFTAYEVAEVVLTCKYNNWVQPSLYQGMYNVITRNIEPELVAACRRYGLDIVVYNPLAGGLFSGKIRTKDILPESGRFSNASSKLGTMYRSRYFKDSTFNALKVVETAIEAAGLTMLETALRWTVHHSALKIKDGNDGIIIGVSSVEQLESNLVDLEKGPLPNEVVEALDEAWKIAKADSIVYWHGDLEYGYDTKEVLFGADAK